MDTLSNLLQVFGAQSYCASGMTCPASFAMHFPAFIGLKFFCVEKGAFLFRAPQDTRWTKLKTDEILIIAHPTDFWMATDLSAPIQESATTPYRVVDGLADYGGRDNIALAGKMRLLASSSNFLLSFLPPVIHIPKTSSATLHWLIGKLYTERMQVLPGADVAGKHLVELVMLEALRYAIACHCGETPNLLSALGDTKIRKVLDAIHTDAAKPWRLEDLAEVAALSRTRLAERFRQAVGVPPATYLTMWRMQLACRQLTEEKPSIKEIGLSLGFGSVSAFSSAFRRQLGVSPQKWREDYLARLEDKL